MVLVVHIGLGFSTYNLKKNKINNNWFSNLMNDD